MPFPRAPKTKTQAVSTKKLPRTPTKGKTAKSGRGKLRRKPHAMK